LNCNTDCAVGGPPTRLAWLSSPAFVTALALLVLNDVALKPLFHNALTGKLSDFAGLFALTLFVATLWPRQSRRAAWAIALAFTFWKTPYAEPLIGALNAVSPVALGRTVDLWDFVALPMIPLAAWAAPRMKPWPLPRALQVLLAVLAPLAFAATSRLPYAVRGALDVGATAEVDEAALQSLVDEVAADHRLVCSVCDPLAQGRVYGARPSGGERASLVVSFDDERETLFFATTGYEREGRRGVLALSESLRAAMQERFLGTATIEFTEGLDARASPATELTVRLPGEEALSVATAEQAKRTLSSIIEEVVREHGLRTDASALVYYAGRRVGTSPFERDLVLTPQWITNSSFTVRVARLTESYAPLQKALTDDLAARLVAAFGPDAVTRQDFGAL
jgi:hypothetical protein